MWRTALKQWNEGKEYWAIPRKDTGAYRQVIGIVDKLKNPTPVVRVEAVADPRKMKEKESLIGYSLREASKEARKRELEKEISRGNQLFDNYENYWPEMYKKVPQNEKLNLYNEIYSILDIKYYLSQPESKPSPIHLALKDRYEAFEIPEYAKKGYKRWLENGRDYVGKHHKGRAPNDKYNREQNAMIKKAHEKNKVTQ